MATDRLPPPPIHSDPGSFSWQEYQVKMNQWVSVNGVPWSAVVKNGSNITDITQRSHNDMQSFQGGVATERYHLTEAQHTKVVNETATTQAAADNSTKIATTAYVQSQGYATITYVDAAISAISLTTDSVLLRKYIDEADDELLSAIADLDADKASLFELSLKAPKDSPVFTTAVGFNGNAAIGKETLPAAATDAATTQSLVNAIRTLLINYGLAQ